MPVLKTDRTALEQVFANLIGNAVKHHDRDRGHITVSAIDKGCQACARVVCMPTRVSRSWSASTSGLPVTSSLSP